MPKGSHGRESHSHQDHKYALNSHEAQFLFKLGRKLKEDGNLAIMIESGVARVADTLDQIARGVR